MTKFRQPRYLAFPEKLDRYENENTRHLPQQELQKSEIHVSMISFPNMIPFMQSSLQYKLAGLPYDVECIANRKNQVRGQGMAEEPAN